MNICVICNGYPTNREPQWGCFERDQALALKSLGHEVTILYIDCRFRFYWREFGISKRKENDIYIYSFFLMPTGWIKFFSRKLKRMVERKILDNLFCEYIRDLGKPDIIYAHYLWNIYSASFLKEKYGIHLVGIEHWSGLTSDRLNPHVRKMGNVAYSKTDQLLAVSKSLQSIIKNHFGKDSTVVYDMLGQEFVTSDICPADKHEIKDNHFVFVSVGSLIYRKGFDVLLCAFAKSNLAEKGCSIIIIGDGPEKKKLKRQINDLRLSDCVKLVGRMSKSDIIHIMSECQAFVLSSRAETFGVVYIEAMSQGLPVIATDCGGPEEFINEKNGFLISPDDIDALTEAMCRMYENYCQYDKAAIARECLNNFTPQMIANQLTKIFEKVLN